MLVVHCRKVGCSVSPNNVHGGSGERDFAFLAQDFLDDLGLDDADVNYGVPSCSAL